MNNMTYARLSRFLILCLSAAGLMLGGCAGTITEPEPQPPAWKEKLANVRQKVTPDLYQDLRLMSLDMGDPVYIRIFKEDHLLQLWMKPDHQREYVHFKSFPICKYSGELGPKLQEGDRQAPEGFYDVTEGRLHPASENHLAFNLGFPNEFDVAKGRTGSFLMIHGGCASIGCFAMTDPGIEEIYVLVESAIEGGQENVPVHIFPFAMEGANLAYYRNSPWAGFWNDIAFAYSSFQRTRIPPIVKVNEAGQYRIFEVKNNARTQTADARHSSNPGQ